MTGVFPVDGAADEGLGLGNVRADTALIA